MTREESYVARLEGKKKIRKIDPERLFHRSTANPEAGQSTSPAPENRGFKLPTCGWVFIMKMTTRLLRRGNLHPRGLLQPKIPASPRRIDRFTHSTLHNP